MQTNFLQAILNLYDSQNHIVESFSNSTNRMNSMGESLEEYVKDLFCHSLHLEKQDKIEAHEKHLSYIGNANHPPDMMIKGGDAIEIKKLESLKNSIALNSSYPKNRLYSDSKMITQACRESEDWQVKDFLYVVGVVVDVANIQQLNSLTMIYGDIYASDKETYERVAHKISTGLTELSDIELAKTNELGRVNAVDLLKRTNLRIRGMWQIENPNKVFDFFIKPITTEFIFNALVSLDKYMSFPQQDRLALEAIRDENFVMGDVKIQSPNNPAKLIAAKHISYRRA